MSVRSTVKKLIQPVLKSNEGLKPFIKEADIHLDLLRHTTAEHFPQLIRPDPRKLYVTLTADCNYRCEGCHYGRDFMPGHTLPLQIVKDLLDDAKAAGFERIRLYGGEPLLHPDLPEIVKHVSRLGVKTWITTNALLLRKKVDRLADAGLRQLSFGFYGFGDDNDHYVGRKGAFAVVEEGFEYTRKRYGKSLSMHLDWLLMRPTCNRETIHATWEFARRFEMPLFVNLVHYLLPYFTGWRMRNYSLPRRILHCWRR